MKFLIPKDNVRLISSILRHLSGEAYICFEGNIPPSEFVEIITDKKIVPLFKRENPESKYIVVLPLEDNTCELILNKIIPYDLFINEIDAIQIIKKGKRLFLSGDNLHKECISVDSTFPDLVLNQLIKDGIIESYN